MKPSRPIRNVPIKRIAKALGVSEAVVRAADKAIKAAAGEGS